jgi:endonuclease/exonuclease/phosphatase (EEP) superfamily protein YafD
LSRHPFSGGDGICAHREGFLSRTVDVGGVAMTLGAEHLRWPWPFSQWLHIRALAPELGGLEAPIVIGGDFNAVPWSAAVTTFADLSGTRPVPGVGATWLHPALPEGWRAWVGLPIDHVLVSEDVQILSVTRLPPTASDHLPVLVRFRLITGD